MTGTSVRHLPKPHACKLRATFSSLSSHVAATLKFRSTVDKTVSCAGTTAVPGTAVE